MKILIANWKMNPVEANEAVLLAKASDASEVVVCPPVPFLRDVGKVLKKAALGAQDLFWEEAGSFTGQVSAEELKALKVDYVIVGHSERRALGETDEVVAKKFAAALAHGLTPVLCIGEVRSERDGGKTKEVIDRQLRTALSLLPAEMGHERPVVYIAYEPVWAISTNQKTGVPEPALPADVLDMVHYMQSIVRGAPVESRFLYGGSVNAKNLADFVAAPEIVGALVGGASLKATEFKKMIKLARVA